MALRHGLATATLPCGATYVLALDEGDANEFLSDEDCEHYTTHMSSLPAPSAFPNPVAFPESRDDERGLQYWVTDPLGAAEQLRAFRYLSAASDGDHPIVQIGGHGSSLVRWVRATDRRGYLVSPFVSELDWCALTARVAGVADRVVLVQSSAERLPFEDRSIGLAFMPGVLHHTDAQLALGEVRRVLAPGGRFASWDIYDSPAYRLGIRLFGKQEPVACVPLSAERLGTQHDSTCRTEIELSGAGPRYVFALGSRLGLRPSRNLMFRAEPIDRFIARSPIGPATASMVSIRIEST